MGQSEAVLWRDDVSYPAIRLSIRRLGYSRRDAMMSRVVVVKQRDIRGGRATPCGSSVRLVVL